MHPLLMSLGLVPTKGNLAVWLLAELARRASPHVQQLLADPGGSVARLGDLVVWNGASGQRVLAALEQAAEHRQRVEQVVGRIETAQIGLGQSLGALTPLSMATLGVASLSAGFMAWRLAALNRRLDTVIDQLADIKAAINAQNQARLDQGLRFLETYERTRNPSDLHTAREASTLATSLHRNLVGDEVTGPRRPAALHQAGHYYVLALTARARCDVLANDLAGAEGGLEAERPLLTALARATFEEVLGQTPEVYLDPHLQPDRVTLDLMADVYRQAHQVGAIDGPRLDDAGQLFEYLRARVYRGGGLWFRPRGRARTALVTRLKYLMSCLEEVARVESLRLRIGEARAGRLSFQDLEAAVQQAAQEHPVAADEGGPVGAFAFAFA